MSIKVLNKLLLELGTRKNNEHVGSGLGGNASQFLFMISKNVVFQKPIDDQPHFLDGSDKDEIVFQVPKRVDMKAVRKALDSFYSTHPDKNSFSEEQIKNPSFLRDNVPNPSLEVKLLIQALDVVTELVPWLDEKREALEILGKVFSKEVRVFEKAFLKEMRLPADYFDREPRSTSESEKIYKMHKVCDAHPIWGAKISAVRSRSEKITELTISQEDLDKMNIIGSMTQPIALFVIRSCIGIDRMVALNLDERVSFLSSINKSIEEDCGDSN